MSYVQLPIRIFGNYNEIRVNLAGNGEVMAVTEIRLRALGRPRPIIMELDLGWLKLTVDGYIMLIMHCIIIFVMQCVIL